MTTAKSSNWNSFRRCRRSLCAQVCCICLRLLWFPRQIAYFLLFRTRPSGTTKYCFDTNVLKVGRKRNGFWWNRVKMFRTANELFLIPVCQGFNLNKKKLYSNQLRVYAQEGYRKIYFNNANSFSDLTLHKSSYYWVIQFTSFRIRRMRSTEEKKRRSRLHRKSNGEKVRESWLVIKTSESHDLLVNVNTMYAACCV